jgi:hypothetical protein
MSAIYNRRAGTHDAIACGETEIPHASQPVEKITMATKSKAKKSVAKKPAAKKKKK